MDGIEGTAPSAAPDAERARLEALSREMIAEEYGDGSGANSEFGGGQPNEPTTIPGATAAGGEPNQPDPTGQVGTANDGSGDGQGTDKAPKWAKAMPESLRGRLGALTEEERSYLQEVAENGLRQSDYSRLVQELPKKEEVETLMQSHRALQAIKANPEAAFRLLMGGQGGEGNGQEEQQEPESVDALAAALMEKTDPREFAATFKRILDLHGQSVRDGLKQEVQSTPTAKARRVNAAATAVRQETWPDLDDATWAAACKSFQESCEAKGADWREVNPEALEFLLEPHVKLAQLSPRPTSTKPDDSTEPRAAALTPGQTGTTTRSLDPWDREGREASDDELFEKTLGKFGLTEQQLAGLRSGGIRTAG